MKVTDGRKTDAPSIVPKDGVPVAGSDEEEPGVMLDFDEQGHRVSLEVLDASERITEARRTGYRTTE